MHLITTWNLKSTLQDAGKKKGKQCKCASKVETEVSQFEVNDGGIMCNM